MFKCGIAVAPIANWRLYGEKSRTWRTSDFCPHSKGIVAKHPGNYTAQMKLLKNQSGAEKNDVPLLLLAWYSWEKPFAGDESCDFKVSTWHFSFWGICFISFAVAMWRADGTWTVGAVESALVLQDRRGSSVHWLWEKCCTPVKISFLLSHLSEGSVSAEKYFGSAGKEDLKYQVRLFSPQWNRISTVIVLFSFVLI